LRKRSTFGGGVAGACRYCVCGRSLRPALGCGMFRPSLRVSLRGLLRGSLRGPWLPRCRSW